MRILVAAMLVLGSAVAGAENTVIDNTKTLTIDCAKDPVISLIGNHNTITLTGPCKKLQITGNHEVVKGSSATVFIAGNDNVVELDSAEEITVAGSNNTVSWKQGTAKLTNSGKGNKVSKSH